MADASRSAARVRSAAIAKKDESFADIGGTMLDMALVVAVGNLS